MDKNEVLAVLNDWNIWRGEQDTGIGRSVYLDRLESLMGLKTVKNYIDKYTQM